MNAIARFRTITGGKSAPAPDPAPPASHPTVASLLSILNIKEPSVKEQMPAAAPLETAETQLTAEQQALLDRMAWDAWDIRFAAVEGLVSLCLEHGGHPDRTNVHSAQIRQIMAIGEAIVFGDAAGYVPHGFGEPVRVKSEAIVKAAMAKAAALNPKGDEAVAQALKATVDVEGGE